MNIVEPSAKLIKYNNEVDHIAYCARVCYGSDRTDNNQEFYNALQKRGHISMFRHETHYFIVNPCKINIRDTYFCRFTDIYDSIEDYKLIGINIKKDKRKCIYYIVANGNWLLDNLYLSATLFNYEVSAEEFNNTEIGHSMMRYTIEIETQISTSRELNRVSPNNIAERSTRYVKQGSIVRPWWLEEYEKGKYRSLQYNNTIVRNYLHNCEESFLAYNMLINNGMKKEDARGILPLDTYTKVIYTYSIEEWKHIIDLRLNNATGRAHGNAAIITKMIENELEQAAAF